MNRESSRSHAVFTMTLESKVGRFNKNLGSSSNQYYFYMYLLICLWPSCWKCDSQHQIPVIKPLCANIHIQILQTDLHTFPYRIMHQSKMPAAPIPSPPPPPGYCKALFYLPCQSRVWGISKLCLAWRSGICQPRGHLQAFDTHVVSYPNITMEDFTGITSRMADWLIC